MCTHRARELSDLGCADDYTLCASCHPELQRLLDCYDAYCREHGLIIDPAKCEVVVFAGKRNTWARLDRRRRQAAQS